MFETLLSSVTSLIALVGFFFVVLYGSEVRHNGQYRKGKRGAQFDHNNARRIGLLLIPITLLIIFGGLAVVFHSVIWLIGYLSSISHIWQGLN